MEKLYQVLSEKLNLELQRITISNKKRTTKVNKIAIRPCLIKNDIFFQFTTYEGTKVFHENLNKKDSLIRIKTELTENFKQIEAVTNTEMITALISKKNIATIKRKKQKKLEQQINQDVLHYHNREKNYLLPIGTMIPFLVDLGIQTKEGKIVDKKYHKFKQMNRFLELIQDILPALPKDHEVSIIDFGCGKSYLTFAMYYFLKVMNGYQVKMIGLDLKRDVIHTCNQLRTKYGYENLDFYEGDISTYKECNQVDMVVTLHACDTATDYAIAKAIEWESSVILSVPCCQHEANEQIQNDLLQPVLKYGILKERMSALLTDGLRANILEQNGYKAQILEFVDMSHTPKNLMIRAIKNEGKAVNNASDKETRKEYLKLTDELRLDLTLEKLMRKEQQHEKYLFDSTRKASK